MLKQTAETSDQSQVLNFGGEQSLVRLGTFGDIIHGRKSSETLSWKIKWEKLGGGMRLFDLTKEKRKPIAEGKEIGLEGDIKSDERGKLHTTRMMYEIGGSKFEMKQKADIPGKYELIFKSKGFNLARNPGRAWDLPQPVKFYGFPNEVRAHYQNANFLWRLEFECENLFGRIYYLGPLREEPQPQYVWGGGKPSAVGKRGEKVVDALLSEKEKLISRGRGRQRMTLEQYVDYWLKEMGMTQKFDVKQLTQESNLYEIWIQKSNKIPSVRITDIGFGVSQVLPVLVLCYYVPEGSIILLEQPEIHLHPSAQSWLADVFIDAVKTRKIQIIIESHSEHLLRRLQRRVAEKSFSNEDTALYFCDIKDGVSELKTLKMNLFGSIENWPKDFFGDSFGEIAATSKAAIDNNKGKQG
jgi:hypothetical protein